MIGDGSSNDAPGAHHRVAADAYAREESGICANGSAFVDGGREDGTITFAPRPEIIGHCHVGTEKNVVRDPQAVPQVYTALDRYTVTQNNIALNEAKVAYVAIATDNGTFENVDEGPNTRPLPYVIGLNKRVGMDKRSVTALDGQRHHNRGYNPQIYSVRKQERDKQNPMKNFQERAKPS